ncbi:MAG: 30S ribosomal protein S7 [Pseudomonadota bacterium]|jgi:small subunit ribosomal protein S7|nr:30S ribosomal protein S7 [Pseudomonadota bacterium]QKK05403.1 MAG: 30S ribosomal protein S7 [Pseudomonadota bacterium]
MSRRRRAEKREVLPDPKYLDTVVAKFINGLMKDGRRSKAERIFYGAMEQLQSRAKVEPLELFHDALNNVKPSLQVRSRRVGGATYQVPTEVRPEKQQAMAIRWIIDAARGRSETTMIDRLARELEDASNDRGTAVKKREDTHKMAEANKAFAHYRW